MKNKKKQANKGLERIEKTFRASSVIFDVLMFIGGVAIAGVLIWVFVCMGTWIKIGL